MSMPCLLFPSWQPESLTSPQPSRCQPAPLGRTLHPTLLLRKLPSLGGGGSVYALPGFRQPGLGVGVPACL